MRFVAIIGLAIASVAIAGPTARQAGSRYSGKTECQTHLSDCPSDTTRKCIKAIIGARWELQCQ